MGPYAVFVPAASQSHDSFRARAWENPAVDVALVLDLAQQGVIEVDHDRHGALQEVSVVDRGRWECAVGTGDAASDCCRKWHRVSAG